MKLFKKSKKTKKIKELNIPKDKLKSCHAIIHTAATASGGVGAGLAQLPASDSAVIVPIQIGMIVSLGTVFKLKVTESVAKSIIATASATIAGRTASQFLVGWIPFVGNAINTATATGLTEAIGWIAVKDFYERSKQQDINAEKEGYIKASTEFETKLKKQAEEFESARKTAQKNQDDYEELIRAYKAYIDALKYQNADKEKIAEIENTYNGLISLK